MRIIILEDETLAAERLSKMILEIDAHIEICAILKSIVAAKEWLASHTHPDLIFSDIRLLDGLSFELFSALKLETPVIFTTAYDQYAIKAFDVNSIDYLLKPIDKEKLAVGIQKYQDRTAKNKFPADFESLYEIIQNQKKTYKTRFLVKLGQKILAIPVEKIAYFFSQSKLSYLVTLEGKKLPIDQTLDILEDQLDPKMFYRANRQYLITYASIREIHPYFKGRIKLELQPTNEIELVISSEKTPEFKTWMDN